MRYHEYINKKKEFYDRFICYIDEEDQIDDNFNPLIAIIEKQEYHKKSVEFESILHLISNISKNHHRTSTFFYKIERILMHYKEYLKRHFTVYDLFKFFGKNPQILYFLFDKKIINIDSTVINLLLNEKPRPFVYRQYESEKNPDINSIRGKYDAKKAITQNYKYIFYNYIRSKLTTKERTDIKKELLEYDEYIFNDFENKCRTGENDEYICKLIRQDSVIDFITLVNRINLPLESEVCVSIFETNPLLLAKRATLIEYAAFYGSIQIFQYLRMNYVELTPSLWLYVIHSNNPEMVHILEENHVIPSDASYTECLKESIKCHHNSLARYIEDNLMTKKTKINNNRSFKNDRASFGFHYYNYKFFPNSMHFHDSKKIQYQFYNACLYDHISIVKFLIQTKKVDINQTIILKINNL